MGGNNVVCVSISIGVIHVGGVIIINIVSF